jgi:hypothetical protein
VRLLHCVHQRIAEHDDHRHVDKEIRMPLKRQSTTTLAASSSPCTRPAAAQFEPNPGLDGCA